MITGVNLLYLQFLAGYKCRLAREGVPDLQRQGYITLRSTLN